MSREKIENSEAPFRVFGERLQAALDRAGLTQTELAQKLGVPATQISDWATGKHRPSRVARRFICAVLRLNEAWLLTGEGAPYYKEGAGGGEGRVQETPPKYGKKELRLMAEIDRLLESGDDVVFQHLKRQVAPGQSQFCAI